MQGDNTHNRPVLTSPELDKLMPAFVRAQAEFKPLAKNRTADVRSKTGASYKYAYADLSDVLSSCRDALSKHELGITQAVVGKELVTCLLHSSGQWLSNSVPVLVRGEGPQEFGSALTYARRYGLTALLGIVAEEDDDGSMSQGYAEGRVDGLTRRRSEPDRKAPHKTRTVEPAKTPANPNGPSGAQLKTFWRLWRELGRTEDQWREELAKMSFKSTKDVPSAVMSKLIGQLKIENGEVDNG